MNDIANPKITVDQLLFKTLYYRYQAFLTPGITIVVCFFLFLFIVMPQIQNWQSIRDSLTADAQGLQIMQQNLATITALNDATINQQLTIATTALPAEKDFTGIVTSLQNAAAVAGTTLGDYSFSLGDLSGAAGSSKAQAPVQLNVNLKGNVAQAQAFVTQLKKQLPLSDTIGLVINTDSSMTVTVIFYYAPIPKIAFQNDTPLPLLSHAHVQLLQTLAANNNLSSANIVSPQASASPTLTPKPTISISPTITPVVTSVASGSAK